MRVLLATHGFPPEQVGGVELHTEALAGALAREGHAVLVVSGTLAAAAVPGEVEVRRGTVSDAAGGRIEVARIARGDLHFDHWHKSLCADVARAFRALVREFRPDVVHVQHWLRLSRDLVAAAAREGVPAVVTLHDAWTSCPIAFRVRPDTLAPCDAVVGPHPCVACAGRVPPRTPWIPLEGGYLLLAERQRDLARELELARALVAPSAAHARALERWLGRASGSLPFEVLAPCARFPAPEPEPRGAPVNSPGDPPVEPPGDSPVPYLHLATWSQIAPHKGLDLLIEAFLLARRELASEALLFLDVHGAEADAEFAAALRRAAGDAAVNWKGPFAAGELAARVAPSAQAFVGVTRAHESYGLAPDEAARLGLALVLPDAPAFVERLEGVAVFYAQGDARALAEQLVRLAREPGRLVRARRAAREFAAALPDDAESARRHLAIYARAIHAGAPTVPAETWFDHRMNRQALAEWDRALARRTGAELGL